MLVALGALTAETARRDKAAKAVRELPPGVEEAWNGYIDRQVDHAIRRHGDMIVVSGIAQSRQFVSRHEPFRILCPTGMAIISFGEGDAAALTLIHGYKSDRAPALGVHPESVAAQVLWSHLCDRLTFRVEAIVTDAETPAS